MVSLIKYLQNPGGMVKMEVEGSREMTQQEDWTKAARKTDTEHLEEVFISDTVINMWCKSVVVRVTDLPLHFSWQTQALPLLALFKNPTPYHLDISS